MKIMQLINFILSIIIFSAGIMGIIIASHEAYHYFMIDGNPTGICMGKCDLGNAYSGISDNTWAPSAVFWEFTKEQSSKRNIIKEEIDAWTFSLILAGIFIGLFVYSEKQTD